MPPINLTEVVCVSSQDYKHPATNIITQSGKWLCSPYCKERSMEATFVFNEPYVILFAEIGNCNSAYISILVSNSIFERFRVLLPQTQLNEVNFFNIEEHFSSDTKWQKWSKVKVICKRPFNNCQFGLNFINISSMPDATKESNVSDRMSSFVDEKTDDSTYINDESSWRYFKGKYRGPKTVNMKHRAMRNSRLKRKLIDYYDDEKSITTTDECNTEQENDFKASSKNFILNIKLYELEVLTAKDIVKKFEDIYGYLSSNQEDTFLRLLSRHVKKVKRNVDKELIKSAAYLEQSEFKADSADCASPEKRFMKYKICSIS